MPPLIGAWAINVSMPPCQGGPQRECSGWGSLSTMPSRQAGAQEDGHGVSTGMMQNRRSVVLPPPACEVCEALARFHTILTCSLPGTWRGRLVEAAHEEEDISMPDACSSAMSSFGARYPFRSMSLLILPMLLRRVVHHVQVLQGTRTCETHTTKCSDICPNLK